MEENPFDVESIDEFLFYCCPQCDIKCKDGKSFIKHARQIHTQAKEVPLYLPTLDFEDEEMPMSENIESTEFNIEDSDEELSDDELYEQKSNDLSVNSNDQEELSEFNIEGPDFASTHYCCLCRFQCDSYTKLTRHMKIVHQEPKYECDNCDFWGPSDKSLKWHVCQETVPRKRYLHEKLNEHYKDNPYFIVNPNYQEALPDDLQLLYDELPGPIEHFDDVLEDKEELELSDKIDNLELCDEESNPSATDNDWANPIQPSIQPNYVIWLEDGKMLCPKYPTCEETFNDLDDLVFHLKTHFTGPISDEMVAICKVQYIISFSQDGLS